MLGDPNLGKTRLSMLVLGRGNFFWIHGSAIGCWSCSTGSMPKSCIGMLTSMTGLVVALEDASGFRLTGVSAAGLPLGTLQAQVVAMDYISF